MSSPERQVSLPVLPLPGVPLAWSAEPRVPQRLVQRWAFRLPLPPAEGPNDGGPACSATSPVLPLAVCLVCGAPSVPSAAPSHPGLVRFK